MPQSPVMSMTGFGSVSQASDRYRITVRMRSVNHRNLDLASIPHGPSFTPSNLRSY